MRRLLSILLAALVLSWASPASAAIGTPVSVASGFLTSAGITISLNITSMTPGVPLLVVVKSGSSVTSPTCSDGVNTYTVSAVSTAPSAGRLWHCIATNPSAATTLAIGWTGSATGNAAAFQVSGLALSSTLDKTGTPEGAASGTAISPNVAAATTVQASEIVIGVTIILGAVTGGSFVESGGAGSTGDVFLPIADVAATGGGTDMRVSYEILSTTAAPAYGTLWAPAHTWGGQVWTFKAAAAPSGSHAGLLMMGVGE